MKVFFRASIRGRQVHDTYYKKISDAVENLGYSLVDKYLLQHSIESHYAKLEEGGARAYENFYDKEIAGIKTADICLFECSFPSLGTGLQIEKALEFNKPTIVLYLERHMPHFLAGIQDEKLLLKRVKDDTLDQVLAQAFNEAKQVADKRFNFFISPQLLSYLDKTSKTQGITKSTFIRSLILDHMRKSVR